MSFAKKVSTILAVVIFIVGGVSHAQTVPEINDLATKHQACLDEGKDMLGCTSRFYSQMDSLLNLSYKNLLKKNTQAGKDALKTEQRDWLKKRNAYFKKREQEVSKEMDAPKNKWGEMEYMMLYQTEADFVQDRVIALIKKSEQ
jgi:uncharacterized protein YecT (DUF1311 family)